MWCHYDLKLELISITNFPLHGILIQITFLHSLSNDLPKG